MSADWVIHTHTHTHLDTQLCSNKHTQWYLHSLVNKQMQRQIVTGEVMCMHALICPGKHTHTSPEFLSWSETVTVSCHSPAQTPQEIALLSLCRKPRTAPVCYLCVYLWECECVCVCLSGEVREMFPPCWKCILLYQISSSKNLEVLTVWIQQGTKCWSNQHQFNCLWNKKVNS